MSRRTEKAADSLTATDQADIDGVFKLGRRNLHPRGDDFKFRLNVVAPTVADVVTCIGGWLVDRAMLGWDITVLIAQSSQDFRPLHILGVTPVAFDTVLNTPVQLPICDGISVAADLYFGETRVRRHVERQFHRRLSEFTLWGVNWPTGPDENAAASVNPIIVEHHLSVAARSFKTHAMAAALGSWPEGEVAPTETFCDGRLRGRFRQSPLRVVQNDGGLMAPGATPPRGDGCRDCGGHQREA
jgi:hypothetical protein